MTKSASHSIWSTKCAFFTPEKRQKNLEIHRDTDRPMFCVDFFLCSLSCSKARWIFRTFYCRIEQWCAQNKISPVHTCMRLFAFKESWYITWTLYQILKGFFNSHKNCGALLAGTFLFANENFPFWRRHRAENQKTSFFLLYPAENRVGLTNVQTMHFKSVWSAIYCHKLRKNMFI